MKRRAGDKYYIHPPKQKVQKANSLNEPEKPIKQRI
jgi:hypothetical protein